MRLSDIPIATREALAAHEQARDWVMVVMCGDPAHEALIDSLLPDEGEDPSARNYTWYRVDAAAGVAQVIARRHEIEAGTRFVILSPYAGEPDCFVLDDLVGRDPEDVLQFMDDHASAIELEYDPDFGKQA